MRRQHTQTVCTERHANKVQRNKTKRTNEESHRKRDGKKQATAAAASKFHVHLN